MRRPRVAFSLAVIPRQPSGLLGALVVVALWAAAHLAAAAWLATRGFDRTDEGFYLNAISHPGDDRSTILLFGYAYHPIWALVGGNVVALRWTGLVLTVVTCGALAWTALGTRAFLGNAPSPTGTVRAIASLGVGVVGLLSLVQMPQTPSYNSLTQQGLAIAATGLILGLTRPGSQNILGWMLLGVGGWLTFLGKPSSAAVLTALVVLVLLVTLLRQPASFGRATLITLCGCLLAAAVTLGVAQTSPAEIVRAISNGLQTSRALGGHDDLVRWDAVPKQPAYFLAMIACAGTAALGLHIMGVARQGGQMLRGASVALVVTATTAVGAGSLAVWRVRGIDALAQDNGPVATLFAVIVGIIVVLRTWRVPQQHRVPSAAVPTAQPAHVGVALGLFLVLLPPAYALGTNNNFWATQGRVAVFPLVLLTALLATRSAALLATPFAALIFLAPLQATTALHPYRYEPLLQATIPTRIGDAGSVDLTPSDAARTARLRSFASQLGIGPDTFVVDLTGDSPGYIFQMGARAAGQAWILGGYPGSEQAAALALRHDRCRLENAWVLTAVGAPRAIPIRVLHTVGLDLDRDFTIAGTFERNPDSHASPDVTIHAPRRLVTRPDCH